MKKILSLLVAITLIGTSTTSLVACNTPQQEYTPKELAHLKKENQIDTTNETIKNNLEWIAPQEKPFNDKDDKWYYFLCRIYENDNWEIFKFKNKEIKSGEILTTSNPKINMSYWLATNYFTIGINKNNDWSTFQGWIDKNNHFKSVYRWNLDTQEPDLILDENSNIKVKGE